MPIFNDAFEFLFDNNLFKDTVGMISRAQLLGGEPNHTRSKSDSYAFILVFLLRLLESKFYRGKAA